MTGVLPRVAETYPGFALTVMDLDPPGAAIRAAGELDLAARQTLAEVFQRLEDAQRRVVRLDLSQVTFLDCSCIDLLVAAHHRLLDIHGGLVLTGVGARIARILTIISLRRRVSRQQHEGLASFDALMAVANQLDDIQDLCG